MRRNIALVAGAAAAAAAAAVVRSRRALHPGAAPAADARADELRRKLAQARETAVDEDDFEAAGMAAETIVEEEPGSAGGPAGDVESARRRVHEEARAAAEEMRRAGERAED